MPIRIIDYLNAQHFVTNPFDTVTAEQELERLPSFFVRAPWFDRLVGDTKRPESLILFAPRGFGKTSHRLEVARIASERRDAPALVVTFTEFDLLLQEPENRLTNTYLSIIRRKTLEAIIAQALKNAPVRDKLQHDPDTAARFSAMQQLYASPTQVITPPGTTAHWLHYYQQHPLSFGEWLKALSAISAQIGFASVYLLLDGIDEWTETNSASPDVAIHLLKPLLDAPGILQECRFAFKFFLPQSLEEMIRENQIGRLDRVILYHLNWSERDLIEILSQRLFSYSVASQTSSVAQVEGFSTLCEATIDVDLELAQAAQSSPRQLIRLARLIIEEHCHRVSDPYALISTDTVYSVLKRETYDQQLTSEQEPVLPIILPQDNGQTLLLFFDTHGDVWIGDRRLDISLPRLVYRCMAYLWNNRDRAVSYAELSKELYRDDTLDIKRGDIKNSSDKIVRRLRNYLEPGRPQSRTYIDVLPGTGYVLRNYRNDDDNEQKY